MTSLYFDYNSSAPLRPSVKAAMGECLALYGNAMSVHRVGQKLRLEIDQARRAVAQVIESPFVDRIIFSGSCTESNNTVLGTFCALGYPIITSAIEHPCVLESAPCAHRISTLPSGVVNLSHFEKCLHEVRRAHPEVPILCSLMHANNETGVLQPIADFHEIARNYGAFTHVDAAQSLGRIPVSVSSVDVDYLTASGHKIGGPVGVGFLYHNPRAPYRPLLRGGAQEKGARSGTHNYLAIIGLRYALQDIDFSAWSDVKLLRDTLEHGLQSHIAGVTVWGQEEKRLPNTSLLRMPGVDAQTQLMHFDLEGIAVSSGSACSSGRITTSHVLDAMQADVRAAQETVRISLPLGSCASDVEFFSKSWKKLCDKNSALQKN